MTLRDDLYRMYADLPFEEIDAAFDIAKKAFFGAPRDLPKAEREELRADFEIIRGIRFKLINGGAA